MACGVNLRDEELYDPRPFRGSWRLGDPNTLRDSQGSDGVGETSGSQEAGELQTSQDGRVFVNPDESQGWDPPSDAQGPQEAGLSSGPHEAQSSTASDGAMEEDDSCSSDEEANLSELQQLIDGYCDPHLDWVEWESAPGILRRDYLSRRGDALRAERWVPRFAEALERCGGDASACTVNLPMERRRPPGPFGSGSWFWADEDDAVFGMLHECGASFTVPWTIDDRGREAARNEAAAEFFLFCPPGIAGSVLADHGVCVDDIDFSSAETLRMLKVSGNAVAFRLIRERHPRALESAGFQLEELCDTPLLEPLLEAQATGSVADPRVLDVATARMCALLRQGRVAEVERAVSALKLRAAHAVALLKAIGDAHDVASCRMRADLQASYAALRTRCASSKREDDLAEELVAFARWGDIASLERFMADLRVETLPWCEPGSQVPRKLWDGCVKRLDASLLRFLVAHGLDLPSVVSELALPDESNALIRCIANACDRGGFEPHKAREFLLEALDAGVRLEHNGAREIMQVFDLFSGDADLFGRLRAAGFSFHAYDDCCQSGEGDARVASYLMSRLRRRATAAPTWSTMLASEKPNWDALAYILSHDAKIDVVDERMRPIAREFEAEPERFAALAASVPPDAIRPVSFVIDVIGRLGSDAVLALFQNWADELDVDTLQKALRACSQRGMVESTAFLMELSDGEAPSSWDALEL